MPTPVNFTIKKDGSGDYTTIKSYIAAEATDLVTADVNHIVTIDGTGWDSTTPLSESFVDFNAFTTDASRNIKITVSEATRHDFTPGSGFVYTVPTSYGFVGRSKHFELDGFEIANTNNLNEMFFDCANTTLRNTLYHDILQKCAITVSLAENCILWNLPSSVVGGAYGLLNATVNNSVVILRTGEGAYNGDMALRGCDCTNVVVYRQQDRITYDAFYNCSGDYNAADSTDMGVPGANSITTLVTTDFVDFANHDYRIKTSSPLATAGSGGSFMGAALEVAAPSGNYGFTYTLPTITGGPLSGFVAVLKTADFPSAALNGANAFANGGGNLIAYTDSGKGTRLPVDIVRLVTGVTPDAEVHIRLPSADTGSTIYLEADDVQISQPAFSAQYGRDEVWQDYEFVAHLDTLEDSTGKSTDLIVSGAVKRTDGFLGSDYYCDSSYLYTDTVGVTSSDSFEMSIWIETNADALPLDSQIFAIAKNNDAFANFGIAASRAGSQLNIGLYNRQTSSSPTYSIFINDFPLGDRIYLSATVTSTGSSLVAVHNGTTYTATGFAQNLTGTGHNRVSIGAVLDSSPEFADNSYLDEARYTSAGVTRTQAFVETEAANQSSVDAWGDVDQWRIPNPTQGYGFTYTLPAITGTHSGFPIVLKAADFPTDAVNGGTTSFLNGGGSLRAYTDSGKGTRLPVDIVRFETGPNPDVEIHIRMDSAFDGATIYLEADTSQTQQPAVDQPYGRNEVWINDTGRWLFNEAPSLGATDRTGGGLDLSAEGNGSFSLTSDRGWQNSGNAAAAVTFTASPANRSIWCRVKVVGLSSYSPSIAFNGLWNGGSWDLRGTSHSSSGGTLYVGTDVGTRIVTSSGTLVNGNTYSIEYSIDSSNTLRLYIDGVLIDSKTVTAPIDISGIKFSSLFNNPGSYIYYEGGYSESIRSPEYILAEHENRTAVGSWGSFSAWEQAGAATALVPQDLRSSSSVSQPALGQTHVLTPQDLRSASSVTQPAIGQTHVLSAQDLRSSAQVSSPALIVTPALVAQSLRSASSVTVPAFTQTHVLAALDLRSSSTVKTPVFGQTHVLAALDLRSSTSVETPAFGQTHVLLSQSLRSLSTVSLPALNLEPVPDFEGGATIASVSPMYETVGGSAVYRVDSLSSKYSI